MGLGLSVLALCAFAPGPAAARASVGNVAGTVVSANGSPIAGAGVTIETAEGSHPHFTKCDLHGHFVFSHYSRGQYNLRAYAGGRWSEWIRNVAVKPGRVTLVQLRLPPASHH